MDERHHGGLNNILYLFILPFIFTGILLLVILMIMGYPVGKQLQAWGNSVPIINHIVPGPSSIKASNTAETDSWQEKYRQNNQTIKSQDQEIASLKEELLSYQKNLEDMKLQNQQLESQLDTQQTQAFKDQIEKVAGIYESIPSSKAASMIESMAIEDACLTLYMLDEEMQSKIISSMKDSKKAAEITMTLKEMAGLNETNETSLKDKIKEIVQIQANPTQSLADTLAGMPSSQSAGMIKSMMGTNSEMALELMKNISDSNRAQILTEIAKTDAALAAKITSSLK